MLAFIIPWGLYFLTVWIGAIQVRPDGWYAAYLSHWGDGAAHLSYMSTFSQRMSFPVNHPLFLGHPFTYSFAADMIGGLIVRTGLPLWFVYNAEGFLLSLTTIIAIWFLCFTLTHSKFQSWVAGTLFLTSGGLGWKYLLLDRWYPELVVKTSYFPTLLTQRENTDLAWLNTIVGELIPQRSFLLALPVGVFLLITWYRHFIVQKRQSNSRLFFSGVLLGLLPIIHPHTAMVMGLVVACWGLLTKTPKRSLIFIAIPTILIGGFLTLTFLSPSVSEGFFHWYPGWLARTKHINWLVFWWDNWGFFLPLSILGTIRFSSRKIQIVLIPFWIWFALANLFLFQPYDWDNSKILTWIYLLFTVPVSAILVNLWSGSKFQKVMVTIIFVALTAAGGIDAMQMLNTRSYALRLVSPNELQLAQIVNRNTAPDAIILTSTTHRNWVAMLTGRQILCGYLGWMWTYGIKSEDRVTDMRRMFRGDPTTPALIKQYGIDYVVIGPEERNEFDPNETYFSAHYSIFTEVGDITIYSVAAAKTN